MSKINVAELIGAALDYAVALADGYDAGWLARNLQSSHPNSPVPKFSLSWADGGPIIEREGLGIEPAAGHRPVGTLWSAEYPCALERDMHRTKGQTPLIAAMRSFVASKLGDEVDVPDELLETA